MSLLFVNKNGIVLFNINLFIKLENSLFIGSLIKALLKKTIILKNKEFIFSSSILL